MNPSVKSTETRITEKQITATNKARLRQKRINHILHPQSVRIGRFERWYLRWRGQSDGKNSLPRECSDGVWLSPFMSEKLHALDVFGANEWKLLQHEHEGLYVRMDELMDSIQDHMLLLSSIQKDLARVSEANGIQRKKGEETLPESIIHARRTSEHAKRLAPLQHECAQLKQQIAEAEKGLRIIVSSLEEDCNTTCMFIRGKQDSVLQRLDVYWHGAMKKHPHSNHMPIVPKLEVRTDHEQKYMELHRKQMARFQKLLVELRNVDPKEVA